MPLNCGIVGLPNVGKSTIFSALTSAPAAAENYPFCTIDPNVGVVDVPDDRPYRIAEIIPTQTVVPATVEFVDIAGLVAGASRGEGLGNRFLGHIRETGVIVHVVRCFEDPDVAHVAPETDPVRDMETVETELALADLETVDRRLERVRKERNASDRETAKRAAQQLPVLEKVRAELESGRPARAAGLISEEQEAMADLHLITMKPQLLACNVDENGVQADNEYVGAVKRHAADRNDGVVMLCGRLEAEIATLESEEERRAFREAAGLEESGLARLIHASYELLGLRTFFTTGPKEVRARTFRVGQTAHEVAGTIHTDFQRGFIRAETYHCEDLFAFGSERKLREAGKLRQEGKEYRVQDGDVLNIKFNV